MGKLHSFKQFLASRRGQIIFNLIYSWGAAVVIFGAMCKIMHFGGIWDWFLMVGLIIEIIVFIAAGLDYSSTATPSSQDAGVAGGGILVGGAEGVSSEVSIGAKNVAATTNTGSSKVGSSGSVVVISGGGNAQGGSTSGVGATGSSPVGTASGSSQTAAFVGGGVSTGGGSVTPEYAQSLTNTAQNLEDFSNTIHSLNQASQKMLDAYKNVTETQGFVDNLATLNQNVSGLNDVFGAQMQTITEQMSAIRYINDSLQRMRNLYDGAIGDSYMFKEESAKMTRHIEALNNVYARLLQAMTTNNNNNMNQNNF